MAGPPGSGKSMLAQRFAGLLPAMTVDEALESAAIASLAGPLQARGFGVRPRASPTTASAVALVGGGSPPRPGEISLAHRGVLFLDELPGIPPRCAGALREPLGERPHHHRPGGATRGVSGPVPDDCGHESVPCGFLGSTQRACRCTPTRCTATRPSSAARCWTASTCMWRCPPLPAEQLVQAAAGESTASIRARVQQARALALARQGLHQPGAAGPGHRRPPAPGRRGRQFLNTAAARLGWSARSTHRALKVARTIADLAGATTGSAM